MGFEFQILDKLQTIHTPLLDRFMVAITKLGDAGIVWIILTVILLYFISSFITDTKNKKIRSIHGSCINCRFDHL